MMRRRLLVAAGVVLGWVAIWLILNVPALFLLAVVIVLAIWLVIVMEQRDEAQVELWEERFKNAGPADQRPHPDVVDVPLYPHRKDTW